MTKTPPVAAVVGIVDRGRGGMNGAGVVTGGSFPAAVMVAMLAGLLSFVSPCVLPLVPGYLGFLTGLSDTLLAHRGRARLVAAAVLFVVGFSSVFVITTTAAAQFGSLLVADRGLLVRLGGVFVAALGLAFLGVLPWRARRFGARVRPGLWSAPLTGIVFALGWSPCVGPTLGAVMLLATTSGDREAVLRGGALGFAYCLGLGVPFIAFAFAFERTGRLVAPVRRRVREIQVLGGLLLVLLGLAMLFGIWDQLTTGLESHLATWH